MKKDPAKSQFVLTIYDDEFNIVKQVNLVHMDTYTVPEVNIGRDGYIYLYTPKYGIRKYDPDGKFINQVGDYFGTGRIEWDKPTKDGGAFGNSLFDNDTKSVPYQGPVVRNSDAHELLPDSYQAKRKQSLKNGILSLDYSNAAQTVLTVYDNELNVLSNINVDVDRDMDSISLNYNSTFDQVYDDIEGNIYVNNIKTKNIDIYDRSGTLKRSVPNKGDNFVVLPNGRIYFFKSSSIGKGETKVEVIVTDDQGNEIVNTTL